MINEVGTKMQCPCGEWVNLTLTVGPSRREHGEYTMPISFDKDKFAEDFSAHVLANPEHDDHARFVTRNVSE
jgi:hypothetical protein